MPRLVVLAFAAFVMLAAAELEPDHAARACSGAPNFDPVVASDVIVKGRFLRYEVLPRDGYTSRSPERFQMSVEGVLKGSADEEAITMIHDGICGSFGYDPTGKYAIVGLDRRSGDTYYQRTFYIGEDAFGEEYEAAVRRVQAVGETFQWSPVALGAAIVFGLPLLALAAYYSPRNH